MLASMAFGVMAIAAGVAMLKSALLPRWLGWVSLSSGILGVVPVGDFFALPAIGVWTLIVAGVVYFRPGPRWNPGGVDRRRVPCRQVRPHPTSRSGGVDDRRRWRGVRNGEGRHLASGIPIGN